jgi:hypothetical protein
MTEEETTKIVATADFETDPFQHKRKPEPFAIGMYDGSIYWHHWGDNAALAFITYIATLDKPHIIYMHNGGKFDFFFFLKYASNDKLRIINNRIVSMYVGIHEFRDSYAIFPDPMAVYKKDVVDYKRFEQHRREKYKSYILDYLKNDCLYLFDIVTSFRKEFGDRLTVGSASIAMLRYFHKIETAKQQFHGFFKDYYYGGRCEFFKSGVLPGDWKVYDVNNMYGFVMQTMKHPVSTNYEINKRITSKTNFACVEGRNYGALPTRADNGGLSFKQEYGTFYATIHELEAAEETGSFVIDRVIQAIDFTETSTFGDFINHFFWKRLKAKEKGDVLGSLHYKRIINSSYGKLAQDPENYFDYCISHNEIPPKPWELSAIYDDEWFIWCKPSRFKQYYNIAAGASITGGARAILLRGIKASTNLVYCDTDSVICESLKANLDEKKIGAWKLECQADLVAIAGKKLYALFNNNVCIKKAHKGAVLSGDEIVKVAQGATYEFKSDAPVFKLDGSTQFVHRRIRATAIGKSAS